MDEFQILRVDLSGGTCAREKVPVELVNSFLGGRGLAAHYLATELPAGADPLGPENMLIFMTGPLSGLYPGTCRHAVVTKGPATGGFLDTYAGGYWAWELRKAGLLGVIVTGKAETLSYLEITDDGASVKDASGLAGKSIPDVDDDPVFAGYRVAAIGPAGENRVHMACIGNNAGKTKNGRSGYNGRGGAGAVMGSKNLKCIAVKGGNAPGLSSEGKELRKAMSKMIMADDSAASWLFDIGTPAIVDWTNDVNVLPVKNWRRGSMDDAAAKIGHEAVHANLVSREGCYNCPVNCGPHVRTAEGAFPGAEADKIEYESLGLGASNTLNGDFSSIVKFAELCDLYGLDTISAGAAVAFAMDCAENGYIDDPIRFGDSEGQARLAEEIAYKKGVGADLARGIRHAAKAWNVDDSKVPVCEVKGLEFPAYDPRGSVGMSLAYATADRGACHMRSWPIAVEALSEDPNADRYGAEGKAAFVKGEQDENSAEWSLVGCDFIVYDPQNACDMLKTVGIEMTPEQYLHMGERIWNMVRLFNIKQGWTADDDYMPKALLNPLEDSGRALDPVVFETMKRDYYSVRGWDGAGRPTAELIKKLDLGAYA
jgi:aldehyde:ferredoxin oxidoreductase